MEIEQSESWTDLVLLQELQEGKQAAFTKLYYLHSQTLYRKIMRMVNDEDIAKELLQDLFLKLWENRQKIDVSKSFRSFLYTIAVNLVYDHFRKAAKSKKLESHLLAMSIDNYTHMEEALIFKDNLKLINAAINRLPPHRKQIFIMCKLDGMSYDEVSKELNISPSTIRDHIVKANRIVKEYLKGHPDAAIYVLLTHAFLYLK